MRFSSTEPSREVATFHADAGRETPSAPDAEKAAGYWGSSGKIGEASAGVGAGAAAVSEAVETGGEVSAAAGCEAVQAAVSF
jgi:hypothetical protein